MTSLCPLVKTPCCRCRLSLILRWQHWTRTLPAVEPITAAMSDAVFPWAAKLRIVLMALGVKTRRAPRRIPPLGAMGPTFKSPPIDLLVVIAPRSCPGLSRTGPRHRPATARQVARGLFKFLVGRKKLYTGLYDVLRRRLFSQTADLLRLRITNVLRRRSTSK